jgi:hypothetical protein
MDIRVVAFSMTVCGIALVGCGEKQLQKSVSNAQPSKTVEVALTTEPTPVIPEIPVQETRVLDEADGYVSLADFNRIKIQGGIDDQLISSSSTSSLDDEPVFDIDDIRIDEGESEWGQYDQTFGKPAGN